MKKLIISLVVAAASALGMSAQTSADQRADSLQNVIDQMTLQADRAEMNKKIWGRGRFLRLGYGLAQTGDDFSPVQKSDFSFFLTKGTTYRFPSNPVAGMVKFGIDAVWLNLNVSKYQSPYTSEDWTSEFEDFDYGYDDEDDFDFNLGHLGVGIGMGIGPNVSVAPFALTSIKGLQPLRVSLYFHYSPTMQVFLKSQDGDTEISTAFCHMMTFGGTLTYRAISVGLEGYWGKGQFKPLDFDSIFDEGDETASLGTSKYTRHFANTRFYIQFAF